MSDQGANRLRIRAEQAETAHERMALNVLAAIAEYEDATLAQHPSADSIEVACAWVDYRKDYGVSAAHMRAAHKAFLAGWQAARGELDSGGVQR